MLRRARERLASRRCAHRSLGREGTTLPFYAWCYEILRLRWSLRVIRRRRRRSLKWKAVLQSTATLGARALSNLHPVKFRSIGESEDGEGGSDRSVRLRGARGCRYVYALCFSISLARQRWSPRKKGWAEGCFDRADRWESICRSVVVKAMRKGFRAAQGYRCDRAFRFVL